MPPSRLSKVDVIFASGPESLRAVTQVPDRRFRPGDRPGRGRIRGELRAPGRRCDRGLPRPSGAQVPSTLLLSSASVVAMARKPELAGQGDDAQHRHLRTGLNRGRLSECSTKPTRTGYRTSDFVHSHVRRFKQQAQEFLFSLVELFSSAAAGHGRRHDHQTTVDHALMRGLVTAGPVMRRGASSV